MKLDLKQLRHVLALDRYRSFARAAEAVGLTQPALSRSIQALEKEVGARLFDRTRARVEPTAVGVRLIELAQPLVTQVDLAARELQQMVGLDGGLLRIGAGPFAAEVSVGTAVGRLARRHPAILVDVSVGDWPELYRRVLNGELDVAVVDTSLADGDERLVVERLPEHPGRFYCRAGHPLTRQGEVTLSDVTRFPLAMSVLPRRLHELLGKGLVSMRPGLPEGAVAAEYCVETPYLARRIVTESDAVGIALPSQIEREVDMGRMVALDVQPRPAWLKTSYGIVRLAHRTASPAAAEFMRVLREIENEIDRV
jgi:DNA-binding transcriptional LysR family regulator